MKRATGDLISESGDGEPLKSKIVRSPSSRTLDLHSIYVILALKAFS